MKKKEKSRVCDNEIFSTEIKFGQGETRSLIFKITTQVFVSSDILLFAMKNSGYEKAIVKEYQQSVSELELEEGVYSFVVPFTGEETSALPKGVYLFDLTLINEYGEKKTLMKPRTLAIVPTIGASMEE